MNKLLKKSLLVTLSATLLFSLTGCGNEAETTEASEVTKTTKDIVVGINKIGVLDPPACIDVETTAVLIQLYTPLFIYGPDSNPIPVGVETYNVSDDGLVYTLNLRQDMKWSDGEPLTAHHYEYGIKRSLGYGPEATESDNIGIYVLNAEDAWSNSADVADMGDVGVKSIDDYTLEITLKEPAAFFLPILTTNVYLPQRPDIATEHDSEWALSTNQPTCGAFMLTELNESGDTIVTKNPNYFDAANVKLDTVTFKSMPDTNAQLLAFQNDDIDCAFHLDLGAAKAIYGGQPELEMGNTILINYIQINTSELAPNPNPALQDVNIRRAMAMSINREEFILALDAENIYKPIYGQVPTGIPGENGFFREEADANGYYIEHDLEGAKKLMQEAGYTPENPLTIEYYYNGSSTNDTVAAVLQAQWKQIGINVELKTAESKVFFDDVLNYGAFEVSRMGYSAGLVDPYNFLELFVDSHQSFAVFDDERINQLVEDSSKELDVSKRMDMLKEVDRLIVEENVWTIPVYSYTLPYLVDQSVSGIETAASGAKYFTYVDINE
ncbi:hypothetical protein AN639_04560 [Candidatus Epulonipiscium fishelsonii]|uniref:Uncharacterized protein n=1 Tax=Candidatus Epulonipiscium fishelsonii TaxID=77094 RepID=A0ACC8XFI5_9FIRM|nr:hypothetical protein AN639_04560 [Epulopiscium sp. SCG-B05WGA-EpuloA1]ONI41931.1 hypothetical protein AN396_02725 [Epulopiscium sp. SCG-B11WGA-EpuloA1]